MVADTRLAVKYTQFIFYAMCPCCRQVLVTEEFMNLLVIGDVPAGALNDLLRGNVLAGFE